MKKILLIVLSAGVSVSLAVAGIFFIYNSNHKNMSPVTTVYEEETPLAAEIETPPVENSQEEQEIADSEVAEEVYIDESEVALSDQPESGTSNKTNQKQTQDVQQEEKPSQEQSVTEEKNNESKEEQSKTEEKESSENQDETTEAVKTSDSQNMGETGYTRTVYYEVRFALGNGQESDGVSLPNSKTLAEGARLNSLTAPYKQNSIFLGWFYDADLSNPVSEKDVIRNNMTLYAKFTEMDSVDETETQSYLTITIPETELASYSFDINNYAGNASLKNITNGNATESFSVGSNGKVEVAFEGGKTYCFELSENGQDHFVVDGVDQPVSIRKLNIITERSEVQNLELIDGMIYISRASVSNMTGTALDGLFHANVENQVMTAAFQNQNNGTFDYSGSLKTGDIVAIYQGTRPDKRTFHTTGAADGAIAYVTITGKKGNTYSYETAKAEEVLFTPDILPVSVAADEDGDADNHSITVAPEVVDYSNDLYSALGLDSQTTVDRGDFIAFYAGTIGEKQTKQGYAKIESVTQKNGKYIITYSDTTEEDVLASMDLYNTRNEEIILTEDEISQIEGAMERQALESGFIDEAARYLTALALETDGFKELSDDLDMDLASYSITFADGSEVSHTDMELMAGSKAKITKKEIQAMVAAGKVLQHFEDSFGVRAELSMTLTIEVGDKVEIILQAIFEQEVLLSVNASGGAQWKWKWIFPYIDDYQLNANIDLGTFTGVGITATAKTTGEDPDEGYNWKPVTGNKAEQKMINIGKQITELMEAKETFLGERLVDENGEEHEWAGTTGGGLAEKYAAFMEEAEESWIKLFEVNIFKVESNVDPLHVLCYGVNADFVVKADLYVTMGMTFNYSNAKRYNFSISLFHKKSTNETIDLEESNYNFDFYVMGTAGIRAGVEFEIAVGLFSLDLDSVGICAEAGAYAQMWGYFYYHYSWAKSTGKDSSFSGAMLIEVGAYLEITFKAQMFKNDNLTYQPTLYENMWPFLQIGSAENYYDFAEIDEYNTDFEIKGVKSFSLPEEIFNMNYMDLHSGDLYGSDADDSKENPAAEFFKDRNTKFTYEISNPKFRYNVDTNTVEVLPDGSINEDCEITIVWKGGTLAFTSKAIERTIKIHWSDPENERFIFFDSNGGNSVKNISAGVDEKITKPDDPARVGYSFDGWYEDSSFNQKYSFPDKMPNYANTDLGKGIIVYAKWKPNTDTKYKVNHYLQEKNGSYTLNETVSMTGTTEGLTKAVAKTTDEYAFFTPGKITQRMIAANGSTIVNVYYMRNTYKVFFSYGSLEDGSDATAPIVYEVKYGSTIYAPKLALGGYQFDCYQDMPDEDEIVVEEDKTYVATFIPRDDTPYRVEHYMQLADQSGYILSGDDAITLGAGTTGSIIDIDDIKANVDGFSVSKVTVDGKATRKPVIGADGKTVIKIYYNRNMHKLIYKDTVLKDKKQCYGSELVSPLAPEKSGYVFEGWFEDEKCETEFAFDGQTMPDEDIIIYAKWAPGERVYTTEHYVMNTYGEYELVDTDREQQTYTETEIVCKELAKDTYGEGISFAKATVDDEELSEYVVPATGELVFKLYYNRAKYHLNWEYSEGKIDESISYLSAGDIYVGTAITAPTMIRNGYTYQWSNVPQIMPADDVQCSIVWTARRDTPYTVEYYLQNANDNGYTLDTAATDSLTGTTDETVSAPEKSFEHFYVKNQVSGKISGDGSTVLKVYYDREVYKVSFDANGGELKGSSEKNFKYGENFSADPAVREDYGFDGWYDGDSKFDSVVTKNMSLVAHWSAGKVNFTVEHYIMGMDGKYPDSPNYSEVVSGTVDEQIALASLKNKNYEIGNGIVYAEATVRYIAAKKNEKIEPQEKEEENLEAQKQEEEEDLESEKQEEEEELESEKQEEEEELESEKQEAETDKEESEEQEALVFRGAYEDVVEEVGAFEATIIKDMTVKLYYVRNEFMLNWNMNGGKAVNDYTNHSKLYYGESITPPVLEKKGYSYSWNKIVAATMPDKDVTYEAIWTPIRYTIKYQANGGEGSMRDQSMTYDASQNLFANTFKKQYHTFEGWATDANAKNAAYVDEAQVMNLRSNHNDDITLYAIWSADTYQVEYYGLGKNGWSLESTTDFEAQKGISEITSVAKNKDGYTFEGWYDAKENGNRVTQIKQGTTNNVKLYAHYTREDYRITYALNGGELSGKNPEGYHIETKDITLVNPVREGYTFAGWSGTGLNGNNNHSVIIKTGSYGDREYIAHWTPITYGITYNLDGGTQAADGNPESYTCEMPSFTLSDPEKKGYTFTGWYDSTGTKITKIDPTKKKTVVLTARWSINQYTISWNVNGGNALTGSYTTKANYGTVITKPNTPSKNATVEYSYTFDGWYTAQVGGVKVTDFGTISENKTYYAHWIETARTYKVTFYDFDGTVLGSSTVNANQAATPPVEPTRMGYTFSKWDKAFDKVTQNMTVYATYRANSVSFANKTSYDFKVEGESVGSCKITDTAGNIPSTFYYGTTYTVRPSAGNGFSYAGMIISSTYKNKKYTKEYGANVTTIDFTGEVFAGSDITFTFKFRRNGNASAEFSWYKVTIWEHERLGSSDKIKATVTWNDSSTTEITENIDKASHTLTFIKENRYPTKIYFITDTVNANTFYWDVNVFDFTNNKKAISSDSTYKTASKVEKTWSFANCGKQTDGISKVQVKGDATARVNLNMYGLNGAKLSDITWYTNNSAATVSNGVMTIDGSKLSATNTSIVITAKYGDNAMSKTIVVEKVN